MTNNLSPFAAALEISGLAIERHNSIPILSNVRVFSAGGSLFFESTDLDLEILVGGVAYDGKPVTTTIPFAVLKAIAEAQRIVDFEQSSSKLNSVKISTAGGATYNVATLPDGEFPHMSNIKAAFSFEIPAGDLLAHLSAVRFGISTEETRYYLNGVFMHRVPVLRGFVGEHLCFVATDGHRLFRAAVRPPKFTIGEMEQLPDIIIPRKAVKALLNVLPDALDSPVLVEIGEAGAPKARFSLPGVTITTKTIDGMFPDYARVIQEPGTNGISCRARDLAAAVRSVAAIASERTRAVVFDFANLPIIRASSPENGDASIPIPGEILGEPASVGLNAGYMLDCCEAFGDATIRVDIGGEAAPVLMTSAEPAASHFTVVQMPMRV